VWFAVNDSRPWWLWPNLLSLDAPAVAVTWQVFLASVAGVAVPVAASLVLGLVVWAVYLADRGLDAHRGANESDRHRVAGQNRRMWLAFAVAAILSASAIALTILPHVYWNAGMVVAGTVVGYFATVHLLRAKNLLDRGLKEATVGVVFAAGVSIPLIAVAEPYARWLAGAVAFAALCWLNCALISLWEDGRDERPPGWVPALAGIVAVLAALDSPHLVAVPVCVSTAALGVLHAVHTRVSLRAVRVLADVVLLSPLLVMW
jgi:hypothetical protein